MCGRVCGPRSRSSKRLTNGDGSPRVSRTRSRRASEPATSNDPHQGGGGTDDQAGEGFGAVDEAAGEVGPLTGRGQAYRYWCSPDGDGRSAAGQSQSLRLKTKYSSAERTTMAELEVMNPDSWLKPGYGRFWP